MYKAAVQFHTVVLYTHLNQGFSQGVKVKGERSEVRSDAHHSVHRHLRCRYGKSHRSRSLGRGGTERENSEEEEDGLRQEVY
uniref:Uncharacterized protein n=1 Tax=Anguilla anguilla TaxID=7936 RepID=A0A0E9TVU3_ANGAN